MLDNALNILIRSIILAGLTVRGFSDVAVKQAYQPAPLSTSNTRTVYFFKIGDKRYGFLGREDVWDPNTDTMVRTESQDYETTFQINALAIQDPNDAASVTASDLVNIVAAILQSEATVVQLQTSNVGILRITDIRNPSFLDDRDQFEASPSFDFTLTHKQVRVTSDPIIDIIRPGIYPV